MKHLFVLVMCVVMVAVSINPLFSNDEKVTKKELVVLETPKTDAFNAVTFSALFVETTKDNTTTQEIRINEKVEEIKSLKLKFSGDIRKPGTLKGGTEKTEDIKKVLRKADIDALIQQAQKEKKEEIVAWERANADGGYRAAVSLVVKKEQPPLMKLSLKVPGNETTMEKTCLVPFGQAPASTEPTKPIEQKSDTEKPQESTAKGEFTFLPFGVRVGGQQAVAENKDAAFARIEKPVSADAEVELATEKGMVIINAFPADDKGNPVEGGQPSVIMTQDDSKLKLNNTMDNKPLAPGKYIMNIVAFGKTARVLFDVK